MLALVLSMASVVVDEAFGRLGIQIAVDLQRCRVSGLIRVVGLVGLQILELLLQVGRLGGVSRAASFLQLAPVLSDVGVDAFQRLSWSTGYSYGGWAGPRYPHLGSI